MLSRLEVDYGRVDEFAEAMAQLVPILEANGWRLRGAFVNRVGRLNRCYDLWEIPDANGVQRAWSAARRDPAWQRYASRLHELVVEEHLEVLDALPYSPEAGAGRATGGAS